MTSRCLASLALLVVVGATPCAAQSVADSLRSLDSLWARTYAQHDTALADRLLADRLVVTSGSGALKSKADEIGDVRPAPGLKMQYFRTTDVRVEVYPQTGIVTGLAEWAFAYNGVERSMRRRYTAVYVRGGSLGWHLAALQIGQAPG